MLHRRQNLEAAIFDGLDVHTCQLHLCFYFTQRFKKVYFKKGIAYDKKIYRPYFGSHLIFISLCGSYP